MSHQDTRENVRGVGRAFGYYSLARVGSKIIVSQAKTNLGMSAWVQAVQYFERNQFSQFDNFSAPIDFDGTGVYRMPR